jgi:hypothetical protein
MDMTMQQALDAAKDMTFEKFWALMMQDRELMRQDREKRELEWAQKQELMRQEREKQEEEWQKRQQEWAEIKESMKKTEAVVKRVTKQVGELSGAVGRFIENMFAARLWEKFDVFGYTFSRGTERQPFIEDNQLVAEADIFLENGDYVMAVEVKLSPNTEDVTDHIKRLEKIRQCMDAANDSRKLLGAIAGGMMSRSVRLYAEKKGLYVLVQSGKSVRIAEETDFKCKVW